MTKKASNSDTAYKAILFKTDGSAEFILWHKHPALADLQELVDGYIEEVRCSVSRIGFTLLANEEGRLKAMDENHTASELFDIPLVGPILLLCFELE